MVDARNLMKSVVAGHTMSLWIHAANQLDAARRNVWIACVLATLCAAAAFWSGDGWWSLPIWVGLVVIVECQRRSRRAFYRECWKEMVGLVGEGAFASLRAIYLPFHQPDLETKADARLGRWLRRALRRRR
jgi:hypothetical protein